MFLGSIGRGSSGARRDAERAAATRRSGLAHILRTHLRRKRDEVVQAGSPSRVVLEAHLLASGILSILTSENIELGRRW